MADIYEPGNRARCIVCYMELDPAPSATDGEPTFRGFLPCPDHPAAGVIYKNEQGQSRASLDPPIFVGNSPVGKSLKLHNLKTHPRYFVPAWAGLKPFEVRKNDRNFMAGDGVLLEEYDPERKCKDPSKKGPCKDVCICLYTGRQIQGKITYVLRGGPVGGIPGAGVNKNWCVFGYEVISRTVSR